MLIANTEADDGLFYFMKMGDWDLVKDLKYLCSPMNVSPIMKLTGAHRFILEEMLKIINSQR